MSAIDVDGSSETFRDLDSFYTFLRKFNAVQRAIYLPADGRYENCAEHSFQLAMMSWYFVMLMKLPLQEEKVLEYALAHDLVEAYAGDTPLFHHSEEFLSAKQTREEEAYNDIRRDFPQCSKLHEIIHNYETKTDEESRLVYAMDKVLPLLGNVYDCGRQMEKEGISMAQILKKNRARAASHQFVSRYFKHVADQLALYA